MQRRRLLRVVSASAMVSSAGLSTTGAATASDSRSGDGTQGSPRQIETVEELQAIRQDPAADYELVSDIDASSATRLNGGDGFVPIGIGASTEFVGTLDGNGHVVDGLALEFDDENYVGLFGYIGRDGSVRNLGLTNVDIAGNNGVGGLAGWNAGDVTGAFVTGDVEPTDSLDSGGLFGVNTSDGVVTKSYAIANVGARQTSSVGGLVGDNRGQVAESYAAGSVTGADSVGGLVGTNSGAVSDSYWDQQATGQPDSDGGSGLITAEMTGTDARANMDGFDFSTTWETTSSYPALTWAGGTGSETPDDGEADLDLEATVTDEMAACDEYRFEVVVSNRGDVTATPSVSTRLPTGEGSEGRIELEPGATETLFDDATELCEPGEHEWFVAVGDQREEGTLVVREGEEESERESDDGSSADGTATDEEAVRADFEYGPSTPATGERVEFDAAVSEAADGTITTYEWWFGDGSTATGERVTHAYDAGDEYTVELRVTTEDDRSDSIRRRMSVEGSAADVLDEVPGPGIVGTLASLGGASYLLSRRLETDADP